MAKNNNLKDYLTDLYEGIASKKANPSRNPQDFRQEIESIETGVDTSDATAVSSDILKGKTAYVKDEKIEGTIETYNLEMSEGGVSEDLIEDAFVSGTLSGLYINRRVQTIGQSAFSGQTGLTGISIPNAREIKKYVFESLGMKNIFFDIEQEEVICVLDGQADIGNLKSIHIPDNMVESYKSATNWSRNADKIIPRTDAYLNKEKFFVGKKNKSYIRSFDLKLFENIPSVEVVSSDENILTISDLNVTLTNIQFKVNCINVGFANITLKIKGDFNFNFTYENEVTETYIEPTYSVEEIEGATYGFNLNPNGYYSSTNKGVDSSYAICKLNINDTQGGLCRVILDCINYGENRYDFGILSKLDKELELSSNDDSESLNTSKNVYKSFEEESSPNVVSVDYGQITRGEHFIYIKYRKDSSTSNNNDTLQFKVRFEEAYNDK